MLKGMMTATLLLAAGAAQAIGNFVTNPTTLYPPGCVSNTRAGLTTPTSSRTVYADDLITLAAEDGSSPANVNVQIFRRGCIEPERSVTYIRFEMIAANKLVALPRIFAQAGGERYPLRLVEEPNSYEHDASGRLIGIGSYEFIVDGLAQSAVTVATPVLTPSQYNGGWNFIMQDALDSENEFSVSLPAWPGNILPNRVPLNGRLTGTWVAEDAADQGFLISFNELVTGDEGVQQHVFFTWYTYDGNGDTLWLTGAATYDLGASQVFVPLELVTGGEFMTGATAQRTPLADPIRLRTEGCNVLLLTYDLTDIGLGADEVTLTRPFSLETAGYACRDLEARTDALP